MTLTENPDYAFTMGAILGIAAWQLGKYVYWKDKSKSRVCEVSEQDPVKNGDVDLE